MITVKNVSKKYRIYHSPADRLKEIVTRKKYHKDLQALSGISFSVASGETLGIVGENGAGKSTLLKILQGVVIPDEGEVEVTGKVTGLLELGTGFNHELTGIENIYMNGTLLGMSREEIDSKKDEIVNFTELGDAINDPIKTYSSGMLMRLGFSIAIHADPACFLVDEALSVGDAYFQQKCMRAIQAFKEKGGSIIFVSHDMTSILSISNKVIWLKKGQIMMDGDPRIVVDGYWSEVVDNMHLSSSTQESGDFKDINETSEQKDEPEESGIKGDTSRSTGQIICKKITIQDMSNNEVQQVLSDDIIKIIIDYYSYCDILNPDYGIQIRDRNGIPVFGVNFVGRGISEKIHLSGSVKRIIYTIQMNLMPGDYFLSLGVANNAINGERCQFESYLLNIWDVKKITVLFNNKTDVYYGITRLENQIEVQDV